MSQFSRRSFLSIFGIGSLAAALPDLRQETSEVFIGRVAARSISLQKTPDIYSDTIRSFPKDTLLYISGSEDGKNPAGNRRWLRVENGYVHAGDVQPVEFRPQAAVREVDQPTLAEVCMPITQSYQTITPIETILYRLYYGSIHLVTSTVIADSGKIWYSILDPRFKMTFYVPAEHLRLIPAVEHAPSATEVPIGKKRIEIKLIHQSLTAYEEDREVFTCLVSAGIPGGSAKSDNSTPRGEFRIQHKTPTAHMGDGKLTKDPYAYELVGVPWVCYFESTLGIALHGAFWHNDFGRARSHGCVNLAIPDALRVYRWTDPAATKEEGSTFGYGTRVIIT